MKDATDAAAKLAEFGADYEIDYIEPELSLREELLMQTALEDAALCGQTRACVPQPSRVERMLDPVLEQALAASRRLNDPRGLYAYCLCREPARL